MSPEPKQRGPLMRLELAGWMEIAVRGIAITGLIYEIAFDKLRNATAIVAFAGLAGLPDVLNYRTHVRQELERERDKEKSSSGPTSSS